jgi:hypothetical protein
MGFLKCAQLQEETLYFVLFLAYSSGLHQTPFQTYYFSEDLVTPGIEPELLNL